MREQGWLWFGGGVALLTALSLFAVPDASAASVETLLMPGKVTRAHVKQEETCVNCHDRTNVRTQSSLCLDCHKDIAADLREHHGFHGRMPNSGVGACSACHTEHKGRDADIVQLGRAQFDHRLTDFAFEGAHSALECESCHKPHEAWRKAPANCAGCHKSDDVHHAQFKQDCGECHGSLGWTGGRYDHDKTQFKLTGAHVSVSCDACHIGGRYKPVPKSCNGCHATDDEHRGARGEDCAKCHLTKDWKTAKYDHLKETGYGLIGAHAQISCLACHRSGNYKDKIPKDCNGCHRADDAHAARFGAKCEGCHDNEHWHPVTYDHAAKAKFALLGAHAKIDCHTCHTGPADTQKLAKDCVGCHRGEDPHGGKLKGGCENCHGQTTWRSNLVFDHDLSDFPLLGLHRVVSCAQCHATLAFAHAKSACVDCHSHDDVHKGGLGKKCESCHSPNGWPQWAFDHAKEAHFPLLGAHSKLQCASCHRAPPGTEKMSQQCATCHNKDDRHFGQYGPQCDRCHTNYSWKGARMQ
jgi:hypothetical protein